MTEAFYLAGPIAWPRGIAPLATAGAAGNSALVVFALYMVGVFVLAWFSNRLLQKKAFLSEYFLGSRSLGVWAFALTFAATSASGTVMAPVLRAT